MEKGDVREPPRRQRVDRTLLEMPPALLPHQAPESRGWGGLRGGLTQAGACVGALNDDVFAGVVED